MKKIVKRIAAMGAAVMMMSSMAIGASAYNSGDTYSSATWTISAKYTQSTKSITKTLKAGNKDQQRYNKECYYNKLDWAR